MLTILSPELPTADDLLETALSATVRLALHWPHDQDEDNVNGGRLIKGLLEARAALLEPEGEPTLPFNDAERLLLDTAGAVYIRRLRSPNADPSQVFLWPDHALGSSTRSEWPKAFIVRLGAELGAREAARTRIMAEMMAEKQNR